MKAEVVGQNYAVEIPMDLFLKLISLDVDEEIAFDESLEKLGAFRLEYNGHFGNFIYFSLSEEDFDILSDIEKTIEDKLKTL